MIYNLYSEFYFSKKLLILKNSKLTTLHYTSYFKLEFLKVCIALH